MKQAQITLFVIIGLSLVLVAAVFIIINQSNTPPDVEPFVGVTHEFIEAVATYNSGAEKCLQNEGVFVFQRIMSQGGYYDTEQSGLYAQPGRTTAGNALNIGDLLIPFWLEQRSSARCTNNCYTAVNIPSLDKGHMSVRAQAERALAERVIPCLDTIEFGEDYDVEFTGPTNVNVFIGEEMITYELLRTITYTYLPTGAQRTDTKVTARQQSIVKPMYEIGRSLLFALETHNETAVLPGATEEIIRTYSLAQGDIPPMDGGVSFSMSFRTWMLGDVKESLTNYLADNIPLLRVKGSRSDSLFVADDLYDVAMYQGPLFNPDLILPYGSLIPHLGVDVFYNPAWDIDLHITPSKGYYITPDFTPISFIPGFPFGIATYQFSYNLIYPVMVVINHPESFEGQGLSLMYGIQTGVRNNQRIHYSSEIMSYDEQDIAYFADDRFKESGIITVITQDGITGQSINEVTVDYVCGDVSTPIGKTEQVDENTSRTRGFLPQCLGGFLVAEKEEYSFTPVPLTITSYDPHTIVLEGFKEKPFTLNIITRALEKIILTEYESEISPADQAWSLGTTSEGYLKRDDEVILFIQKISLTGEDQKFQAHKFYPFTDEPPVLNLVPGQYDVEVMVLRHYGENRSEESLIIPEREVCDGGFLGSGISKECHDIPEIVFDEVLFIGGARLSSELGMSMNVSIDEYTNSSSLTIYVMEVDTSGLAIVEDLEILGLFDDYQTNQEHRDTFKPVFT